MKSLIRMFCVLAMTVLTGQVQAGVINSLDRGWYNSAGQHSPSDSGYIAGLGSDTTYRNFFVFDLAGISSSQTITSARLLLFSPSVVGMGTYSVFDVSTSVSDLIAGGSTKTNIYNDLGTGTKFGEVAIPTKNSFIVSVSFNASGLAALNSARTSKFAVGGSFEPSAVGASGVAYVFGGFTGGLSSDDTRLEFETQAASQTVPEPASIAIWSIGALGAGFLGRRKKKLTVTA